MIRFGCAAALAWLCASGVLAQEEALPPPYIPPPLAPIQLPPSSGDVTFGSLEFEPPPPSKPAGKHKATTPPPPRPPSEARSGSVSFGEIEFELPSNQGWPPGSVRVVKEGGGEYVRLPDGSQVFENDDGSITTLKPDGSKTTSTVSIESIEFDETPQKKAKAMLDRLRKSVKKALDGHRKTMGAIDKALDKRKPRHSWYARDIPGGNAEVGTLTPASDAGEAPEARYDAPLYLPADRVVPIRATLAAAAEPESTAHAVVRLLNTDAVLEARWTIEERFVFTFNRTESGPEGPTITQEEKTETMLGSGQLRFEARPFPGLSQAESDEMAATAFRFKGIKALRQVSAQGSVGLQGEGAFFRSGPRDSERASFSVSGFGRVEDTPSDNANLVVQREGQGWRLIEWTDVLAAPRYSGQQLVLLFESRFAQHTPGSPVWSVKSHSSSRVEDRRNQSIDLYSPMAKPEQNPSPDERVGRQGSLVLAPAGKGRYTGFLRFNYSSVAPNDGVSTFERFRTVTWDFTLQIVEEK